MVRRALFLPSTIEKFLSASPKKIMISGPSGFLGSRVLECILAAHRIRKSKDLNPGEVILLSGSPGKLMSKLYATYGTDNMSTVRATRVDYYKQHDVDTWIDQLGSLGMLIIYIKLKVLCCFIFLY
jgi:hypothetical protein